MNSLPASLDVFQITTDATATQEGRATNPADWMHAGPSIGVVIVNPPATQQATPPSEVFGTIYRPISPPIPAGPSDPVAESIPDPVARVEPNVIDGSALDLAIERRTVQRRFQGRFVRVSPHPAWVAEVIEILDKRYGEDRKAVTPEYLLSVNWECGHTADETAEDIGEALQLIALPGMEGWTPRGMEEGQDEPTASSPALPIHPRLHCRSCRENWTPVGPIGETREDCPMCGSLDTILATQEEAGETPQDDRHEAEAVAMVESATQEEEAPESEPQATERTASEPTSEEPATIPIRPTTQTLDRNEAIRRIKAGLEKRSGKKWSVTGGKGTAWGWIGIDAPPSRRTWHTRLKGRENGQDVYEEFEDASQKFGNMGPADREELGRLLGMDRSAHHQGESIAASHGHRQEFVDRAEGREPTKFGEQYWD